MSCNHERFDVYRAATTTRSEYDAVQIDPDADSDSDPEGQSFWASDDLVAVAEHISRDSESYAATVVRELVAVARSLRAFAERGRRVPEYDDPSVRESSSCASIGSCTAEE
jgi:hypothetical protein